MGLALGVFLQVVLPGVGADQNSQPEPVVDPVMQEYNQILASDLAFRNSLVSGLSNKNLDSDSPADRRRIFRQRLQVVEEMYEDFILRYPDHTDVRLDYASLLTDFGKEMAALQHLLKATELRPDHPDGWNNLANFYGHMGPVKKAFECYGKAVVLEPKKAVYFENFGTTVFLFRTDAREYFQITEKEVFDKALGLYAKALAIEPTNFRLAHDIALTYYGIHDPDRFPAMARPADALSAWGVALSLASDEKEKQSVYIHLARIKTTMGRYDEARGHLADVNLDVHAVLKRRVARTLERVSATSD